MPRLRWHEEPTCQKLLWLILRKGLRKLAVIKIEEVAVVPACQQRVKIVFLNDVAFEIDSGLHQGLKKIGRKLVFRPVQALFDNVFVLPTSWVA